VERIRPLRAALALAILARLTFLVLPPFSTDTGRFLADGQTLLQGRNPYNSPPPVAIEYAHLRSFYPPLQEVFFAGVAFVHPSAFALKLCGGLAELGFVLWFLYRKRRRSLSRWLVAFLLFNPLSLNEVWREGHLDHIAAFFLYFAVVAIRPRIAARKAALRAYGFAALSIAWKFVGVLACLWQYRIRTATPLQRITRVLLSPFTFFSLGFFALQLAPAFVITPFAERGLTVYTNYWHHGNGIVHALAALGFSAPHAVWLIQRGIFTLALVLVALYAMRILTFSNAYHLALGSLLVFFPVQHPWYYFLLFPAILLSSAWRPVFMVLCTLAPLSYLGYVDGVKSLGFVIVTAAWLIGGYKTLTGNQSVRRETASLL